MSPKERTLALLLETIKIEDGEIFNLKYHQKRSTQSRQKLFNSTDVLDLSTLIHPPKEGLYRCRILYAEKLHSVEYLPYTPKNIRTLKIIPSQIEYNFKYANRDTHQRPHPTALRLVLDPLLPRGKDEELACCAILWILTHPSLAVALRCS